MGSPSKTMRTINTIDAHFKYLTEHEKDNAQKAKARLVESLPVDYKKKKNEGVPEAKNEFAEAQTCGRRMGDELPRQRQRLSRAQLGADWPRRRVRP